MFPVLQGQWLFLPTSVVQHPAQDLAGKNYVRICGMSGQSKGSPSLGLDWALQAAMGETLTKCSQEEEGPIPSLSQPLPERAHPSPTPECSLPLGILLALPPSTGALPRPSLTWKAQTVGPTCHVLTRVQVRTSRGGGK